MAGTGCRKSSTGSNPYLVRKRTSKEFESIIEGRQSSARTASKEKHLSELADLPHVLSSSLASSLENVMKEAVLLPRFQEAYDWCKGQGAVEIAELNDEQILDELVTTLVLKKMEITRFKKALERYLKPAEDSTKKAEAEAKAIDALQKALRSSNASELKLALITAGKLKLGGDLVDKCKHEHRKAEAQEIEERTKRIAAQSNQIKEAMPANVQLVLVSSPEHDLEGHAVLAAARTMIHMVGGTNKAGDAKDWFHSMMLSKGEMGRVRWIGQFRDGELHGKAKFAHIWST